MKMKALVAVVVALLMGLSLAGMVYAQGGQLNAQDVFQQKLGNAKIHHFEGTVLSHDVACHCFVVKTGKGTVTLQDDYAKFEQNYDRAKGLMVGKKAAGTYKTIDYINYAIDVHQEM